MDTIYECAVPNRLSSSSEDELCDTSGETDNIRPNFAVTSQGVVFSDKHDKHAEKESVLERARPRVQSIIRRVATADQPGTSRGAVQDQEEIEIMTPEERAQKLIREAEMAKAQMFPNSGNYNLPDQIYQNDRRNVEQFTPAFMIDESYIVVSAHLDENIVHKISKGEYVDFGRLLPRDKVQMDEDGRMEMCVCNGRTYWVPASQGTNINNFGKWEQAFRVFSNIYCKANPHRAPELIEYNHIIHTISTAYIWDNVYMYDKEFRLHMSRNPSRSWGIILQQAWSLRLRDRISVQNYSQFSPGNGNRAKVNEPCRRYNRAKCNYGANCKFEHRCSYCYRFGHGSVHCRKANADRGQHAGGGGHQQNNKSDRDFKDKLPVQERGSSMNINHHAQKS